MERLATLLHGLLAALALVLVLGSPWLNMVSRLKASPPWPDLLHLVCGAATLLLLLPFVLHTLRGGRWRLYFPWLAGHLQALRQDLSGLLRGRLPGSEGSGLFAAVQGLLLLAMVAASLTGLGWWWTEGTAAALDWHTAHVLAGRAAAVLLGLHLLTSLAHLVEFIRD